MGECNHRTSMCEECEIESCLAPLPQHQCEMSDRWQEARLRIRELEAKLKRVREAVYEHGGCMWCRRESGHTAFCKLGAALDGAPKTEVRGDR